MTLFRGTVSFYRQYRPGIPQSVAGILDATAGRGKPRRLLDVGTGTGLVVEALLGRFDDINAIDNDALHNLHPFELHVHNTVNNPSSALWRFKR